MLSAVYKQFQYVNSHFHSKSPTEWVKWSPICLKFQKCFQRNRVKRVPQFKQGHSALYQRCSNIDEASSSKNDKLTVNARVSSFEIQNVLSLVNRAGCSQERTGADVLAEHLRPGVEKDYSKSFNINNAGKSSSSSAQSFSENENIIVNVKKLEKLIISFTSHSVGP